MSERAIEVTFLVFILLGAGMLVIDDHKKKLTKKELDETRMKSADTELAIRRELDAARKSGSAPDTGNISCCGLHRLEMIADYSQP